jgi:hypothetical protein
MKNFLVTLCGILFILGVNGSADAVSFSGTAVGSWENVVSTESDDVYSVDNSDSGGVASFNWGIPQSTDFDNQFTFDGVGSDGDPGWVTSEETPFLIGDFSYRNGSTVFSVGIVGVDLTIFLSVTSPLGVDDTYAFPFSITNTPNTTGDPVLDADIVNITNPFSTTAFNYDGIDYTLALLGFSSDGGATMRTDFSSPEGATAAA